MVAYIQATTWIGLGKVSMVCITSGRDWGVDDPGYDTGCTPNWEGDRVRKVDKDECSEHCEGERKREPHEHGEGGLRSRPESQPAIMEDQGPRVLVSWQG